MFGYQVINKEGSNPSRIIWLTREEAEAYIENHPCFFNPKEQWEIMLVRIHGVSEN